MEVFPLSTEADELLHRAHCRDVDSSVRQLREVAGDRKVIGRVDRTELSKNVFRGLLAYRELLRSHAEWRDRVVHIIDNYPSREDLPEYREYTALVSRLAREIDDEFGTDTWTPLLLDISDDYPGSLAALRISDVVFVNSVRDGMNLVVRKGSCSRTRPRRRALPHRAADALGRDALLVNPFDVSETANALHEALTMPDAERVARCRRLRKAAVALPPGPWFQAQLDAVNAQ
jgi:trehalose 6-phosphate synthase